MIEDIPTPEKFRGEIISEQFLQCVRDAGALSLAVRKEGLSAEFKKDPAGKDELVTKGDKAVSERIQEQLTRLFPGIVFIDEEVAGSSDIDVTEHKLVAVIDPIDGTTNYFNEGKSEMNPNWGISVGIVKNGEIVAGVIFQPASDKLFYAEKGRGAYVNGKRLRPSTTATLEGARVVRESVGANNKEQFALTKRAEAVLERKEASVEELGSQAIAAAEVAEGKRDAFLRYKTVLYDVAAAVAIVREAGGKVLNSAGEPFSPNDKDIIVTNGVIDVTPLFKQSLLIENSYEGKR